MVVMPMILTPQLWNWNAPWPDSVNLPPAHPQSAPTVWLAAVPEAHALLSHLTALLAPEERIRLERLRQRDDQSRFIAARGLLRLLAGAHLHLPPTLVPVSYGPYGKPFISQPKESPPIEFNLSHSGKFVLLAFHASQPVGVDVEAEQPDLDCTLLAAQIFSAPEQDAWSRLSPSARIPAFFQAWTRHEASLKALGGGLNAPHESVQSSRLACFDLALPAGYRGAAAYLR